MAPVFFPCALAEGVIVNGPDSSGGPVGADLMGLFRQLLDPATATDALAAVERSLGRKIIEVTAVDAPMIDAAQAALVPLVGRHTAEDVIRRAFRSMNPALLPNLSQLSPALLRSMLESLGQGVSVVDADLRLVAWNSRYLEMLHYPPGIVYSGRPVEDIVRFSAQQFGFTADEVEAHVARRLTPMRLGLPCAYEREHTDRVLQVLGSPMPGGGYVSTFTDITELRNVSRALQNSNEGLEQRVADRTRQLTQVNGELDAARATAEAATRSQGRFVAAASHDLLQPLHAARLFLASIQECAVDQLEITRLAGSADQSIEAADRLLRALLNLSRLEQGGVKPDVVPIKLSSLFEPLRREFEPLAAAKKLKLTIPRSNSWVWSDRDLLRSVLQNLIGNAIRYTASGSVVVVVRREADGVRLQVRDSGPGIATADLPNLFDEFKRGGAGLRSGLGAGLGLAIARRICCLLGHELAVQSKVGVGSTFSVSAPGAPAQPHERHGKPPVSLSSHLRILCVENEALLLEALETLLRRWGAETTAAASAEVAMHLDDSWDVILADYHLGGSVNGLDLIEALVDRAGSFALLTANSDEAVLERARKLGVEVLPKPVAPAALRAFINRAGSISMQRKALQSSPQVHDLGR